VELHHLHSQRTRKPDKKLEKLDTLVELHHLHSQRTRKPDKKLEELDKV
jgi:hypothetical protein